MKVSRQPPAVGVGGAVVNVREAKTHFSRLLAPVGGGFLTKANPACTKADLVARDVFGTEVTRRSSPLCEDERWVITPPPPPEP